MRSSFFNLATLTLGLTGIAVCALLATPRATAQVGGTVPAFVKLQSTSPGTQQNGNIHVSGTIKADQFQGSGSGLTSLDAGNFSAGLLSPTMGGTGSDTSSAANGSMLVKAGADWTTLGPDVDGTVLTLVGGVPAWVAPSGGTLSLPFAGVGDDGGLDSLFKVENSGEYASILGIASNPLGVAIRGEATDTTSYSYGGLFIANSSLGRGIFAENQSETGVSIAGRFGSPSPDTYAVYSTASATIGDATAIVGETFADSGNGVLGVATSTVANRFSLGVEGRSSGSTGSGIYGYNSSTTGRSAGVIAATNNVGASGSALVAFGNFVAAGTKSFRIDHPFDPLNKYLRHYCSEGPAPYNLYKGRVTTDQAGYAWVQLPNYFEAINRNPDFALTVIDSSDDFVLAKISREIVDNRFQIRTNKPRVTVSWQVTAIRNDLFVRNSDYSDVEIKPEFERGTYQMPTLYNRPHNEGLVDKMNRRQSAKAKGP